MEDAIRKELVKLCREIIEGAAQASLDDQLQKTRLLQEKIILLKYLRFREGEISGSKEDAAGMDKLDQELEKTLQMAEAQRNSGEKHASSSSASPIAPQQETPSASDYSAVSKSTGMVDEKPQPEPREDEVRETPIEAKAAPKMQPPVTEDRQPQEEERPVRQLQNDRPAPTATEKNEPTEAPVEKEKLKEDQPPQEAPQAPQREREKPVEKQRSIHQRYSGGQIKLGLNDRIAFMNHLFEGNQEDLNRVVSQLNTFDTYSEAENFLLQMVKPDYDWSNKEEYEERLIEMVKARFGEE